MADAMDIDEDAQSRQMAVYGRESMQKLRTTSVLISGLNGLGAEIAKNVVLANVKAVTLHDDKHASVADCGAHFFLSEADAGRNRAKACVQQMQELNPGVAVRAIDGAFPMAQLPKFTVVVAVDMRQDVAEKVDAACRASSPPIAFLRADIRGLCGYAFADLGPSFTCVDPTGEQIKSAIVEAISPMAKPPSDLALGHVALTIQCVDDEPLDLDDGDHVRFSEVVGLPGLNSLPAHAPLEVRDVSKKRKSFAVHVPAALAGGQYVSGGLVAEVRMPKILKYRSLTEYLADPGELAEVDESKMAPAATSFAEEFLAVMGSPKANVCYGRSGLLHLGFRALEAYAAQKGGHLPPAVDPAAAEEVLQLARTINTASRVPVAQLDLPERAVVLRQLAMGSRAVLSPMAAIFGGIVGQEVVKAATGKFHPLTQGFYLDALECLPNKELPMMAEFGNAHEAGRYEGQVSVFGRSFQRRLEALNIFLVGSGALGCELLKNLALMGCATAPPSSEAAASAATAAATGLSAAFGGGGSGGKGLGGGKLTVTDDDVIEKSNLARQFLFRNHDVGQSKSLAAARAACKMNPALRVTPLQDRVSPETESVFNAPFWLSTDVIINALDNVKARLYVDGQCVLYGKPLLESGTLGTKCNTQVVIPHLTENYGASRDAPEREAPQCAVHNFPHNIDQCLVLAQSEFVGSFDTAPRELTEFLAGGASWVEGLVKAQESNRAILDKLRGDVRTTCGMAGGCRDLLVAARATTWAQCVGWARRKYESFFVSRIAQLLHNFPPDAVTNQGVKFWSPPKRTPTPLPFDARDPLHLKFVLAAANLRAYTFGVTPPSDARDPSAVARVLATAPECRVETFRPFSDASIETEEKKDKGSGGGGSSGGGSSGGGRVAETVADEQTIRAEVEALLQVKAQLPAGFGVRVNEFEKDDDTNFHMDFIASFANLRARNYAIAEIDQFAAKLKAGRIIPAIATTTAMATGFVCLELYKHLALPPGTMGGRRNLFANLALPGPLLTLSEPMPCARIKSGSRWDPEMYMNVDEVAVPEGHTLWDHLLVPNAHSMTLDNLFAYFATQHQLNVTEFLVKSKIIYSTMMANAARNASAKAKRLVDIIEEADPGRIAASPFYQLGGIMFETMDGDDVKAATVVLQLA